MEEVKAMRCQPKTNGFYYICSKNTDDPVFVQVRVKELVDSDHAYVCVMDPSNPLFLQDVMIQVSYNEFWNKEPTIKEWLNG